MMIQPIWTRKLDNLQTRRERLFTAGISLLRKIREVPRLQKRRIKYTRRSPDKFRY